VLGSNVNIFILRRDMGEKDIFEEIIDIGKSRGSLTYDEINDAFSSEYFSPDELGELMDPLHDMGVEVVDDEPDTSEEEVSVLEEEME